MFSQVRDHWHQTTNNYISGGRGGAGGESHGDSTGGGGGQGMGPSLCFDIEATHFIMNNNVNVADFGASHRDRQNSIDGDPLHQSRSGPVIHQNIRYHGERGIDILGRAVAHAALHDSGEIFPQPKCHPETRTKMLADLRKWTLIKDARTTILWLYGPAGAGKSAIMHTLARELHAAGKLGACFFFKRNHDTRGNEKNLVATIAYQLTLNVPELRVPICQIVEEEPSVVARSIETQMQKLISEPCRLLGSQDPVSILIDGLDECERYSMQEEILRTIRISFKDTMQLRFIIASRPEAHIREMFHSSIYSGSYRALNVEQSFHDVRKYLFDEFSRIHHQHHSTMAIIPSPWPLPEVLEDLVQKSSGHFIYASTIIKFIDDKNFRPADRLALVRDSSRTGSHSAFDALDELYMTILRSGPRQSELVPILCAIANFDLSPAVVDILLGLTDGDTRLILRSLHSVLRLSVHEYEISSYHASFWDFLNNSSRSQNFCIDRPQLRMDLARSLLNVCAGRYRKGWSGLPGWRVMSSPRYPDRKLMPFLMSLPPSPDLWFLIRRMNPDYIFDLQSNLADIVSSLKKKGSAPRDLLELWEDYEYMSNFEKKIKGANLRSIPALSAQHTGSPTLELLQVSMAIGYLRHPLRSARFLLDIPWDKLRNIICNPQPVQIPRSSPRGNVHFWVSRDMALRCIRRMIEIRADADSPPDQSVTMIQADGTDKSDNDILRVALPFLVRLSPPCTELLCELWSIPSPVVWTSDNNGQWYIYHISKWLQTFDVPQMELVAAWKQGAAHQRGTDILRDHEIWEETWKAHVGFWNDTIATIGLPAQLTVVL